MTDCPGACNAAWRRLPPPERDETAPVPGDPLWCRLDTARIRRQLGETDTLAGIIEADADGHREQGAELGRASGAAPSPSPLADLLDEFKHMLDFWEAEYRNAREWPSAPRRGNLATVTTEQITWMARHLDGILAEPRSCDFGHAVADWYNRLLAAARAGSGFRRGVVPCPRCGLKLLGGRIGDGYMACGNCNRYVSDDEYEDLVKTAARAAS